jgi:hypothetical protein
MDPIDKVNHWFSIPNIIEWEVVAVIFFLLASISFFFQGFGLPSLFIYGALTILGGLSFFGAIFISLTCLVYMLCHISDWGLLTKNEKKAHLILVTILVCLNVFFLFGKGTVRIESSAIGLTVARTGGVSQLKEWAEEILEKAPDKVLVDPNNLHLGRLKEDCYSKQVQQINPSRIYICCKDDHNYMVIIITGGGFIETLSGIVIYSEPSLADTSNATLIRWADGVYAFFGRTF